MLKRKRRKIKIVTTLANKLLLGGKLVAAMR